MKAAVDPIPALFEASGSSALEHREYHRDQSTATPPPLDAPRLESQALQCDTQKALSTGAASPHLMQHPLRHCAATACRGEAAREALGSTQC